jgi:hypothetical protein
MANQPDHTSCIITYMAEILAVAGGVASFGQILGGFIKVADLLSSFARNFRNAPSEFLRIQHKVTVIRGLLNVIQTGLSNYPEDIQPPPDLRQLLSEALSQVQAHVDEISSVFARISKGARPTCRENLRWARQEKHVVDELLHHLTESEATLNNVVQLLI